MSKEITSYIITKSEYGIITLAVNTETRWMKMTKFTGKDFVEIIVSNDDMTEDKETLLIPVKEFGFTKDEAGYRELEQQNKDQMHYYFIPVRLIHGDKFNDEVLRKLHNPLAEN
jgi:hypothetical protein